MDTQWHYSKDGEQYGPIGSAELRRLAESGELRKDDLLWKQGMDEWILAERIKNLFPATPPAPPKRPAHPPSAPAGPPPVPASTQTANANIQGASHFVASIRNTHHDQRLAIIVAASAGVFATFLPWVSAPIVGTLYGTAGDGWVTLCLFVPAIVLALRGDKLSPLADGPRWGATIPAGIAAFIGLGKIVHYKSSMSEAADDNPFSEAFAAAVQLRIGIFLVVFAGVSVCVAAWLLEKRTSYTLDA